MNRSPVIHGVDGRWTSSHDYYVEQLVHLAARIVATVHEDAPSAIREALAAARSITAPAGIDPESALMVVLAAMVDADRSPRELVAWARRDGGLVALLPHKPRYYRRNALAVEMGVQGVLPACALNPVEIREVVFLLQHEKHWPLDRIAAHLDAAPADIRRWASVPGTDLSAA